MTVPTGRRRLDAVLADRGFFPSRAQAAASVMAGEVMLGQERARKPGQMVRGDVDISVSSRGGRFVSRGGTKLSNALAVLDVDPSGRSALDAGASTGGFTDCLLQSGAKRVVAVDVGYGELAWSLRQDDRVVSLERTNARHLERESLPFAVDLVACDVSFISLAKVLPALVRCCDAGWDIVALVKPQFEVGRELIGKGGVVRDATARREALVDVASAALATGAGVVGFAPSGLPGPKGNRETFIHLGDRRGETELAAVESLAREVDV